MSDFSQNDGEWPIVIGTFRIPGAINPHTQLLALIAERDAQEAFSRANGWGVLVTHVDQPGTLLGLYGPFTEPSAALVHAAEQESELNAEGEEGFRCHVHPIMPVT